MYAVSSPSKANAVILTTTEGVTWAGKIVAHDESGQFIQVHWFGMDEPVEEMYYPTDEFGEDWKLYYVHGAENMR